MNYTEKYLLVLKALREATSNQYVSDTNLDIDLEIERAKRYKSEQEPT